MASKRPRFSCRMQIANLSRVPLRRDETTDLSNQTLEGRLLGTPLIFWGVVAKRIGDFYAGVILYFVGSVMRRSKS